MSGSRGSRESQDAGYQLGDLDLPAAPRRPAPPQKAAPGCPPPQPAANSQRPARALGEGGRLGRATSVELDEQGPGGVLELDLGPPDQATAPALDFGFGERDLGGAFEAPAGPDLALEMALPELPRPPNAPPPEAAPGPVTSRVHAADEEKAARELADYGQVPTSFVGAVPYACRVALRLLALRGERKGVAQELAQRESDLHAAWVGMGQALMNLRADPRCEPLRAKMTAVEEAQGNVSRAGQTVAQTRAQSQAALSALEDEAAVLNREIAPFQENVQTAEQAYKKAEENLRRGQAMQRRVELELRALAEATKVDPSRSLALEAQLEERKAQVVALSSALAQAEESLGQARRELALRSGGLSALEDRKKRLLAQIRTAETAVEEQAKAAEGSHAAALRALSEAARAQRLEGMVPAQTGQVGEAEQAVSEAQRRLTRYERALQSYDHRAVRNGVIVVIALVAALIVALKLG